MIKLTPKSFEFSKIHVFQLGIKGNHSLTMYIKQKKPFLYLTFKYQLIQQQKIYFIPGDSDVPSFSQSCPLSVQTY